MRCEPVRVEIRGTPFEIRRLGPQPAQFVPRRPNGIKRGYCRVTHLGPKPAPKLFWIAADRVWRPRRSMRKRTSCWIEAEGRFLHNRSSGFSPMKITQPTRAFRTGGEASPTPAQ